MSLQSETALASPYFEPSSAEADGGEKVGKLPASISLDDLRALGHLESPIKSLRAKCVDCSGQSTAEARKCVAVHCALWPFRMGVNPFHGRRSTVEAVASNHGRPL